MSRLLWIGVGAAGGIYVYRKGERAWERTKVRGVSGNATLLAATAAQWYTRLLVDGPTGSTSRPAPNGNAAGAASTRPTRRAPTSSAGDAATSSPAGASTSPAGEAPAHPGNGVTGGARAAELVGTWLIRRAAASKSG